MRFTTSPVLSSDMEEVHRFHLSIDANGPIGQLLFPNGASDRSVASHAALSRKWMTDPHSKMRPVVAKDSDTGEIVSYAVWFFFPEKDNDAGGEIGGEWPSDVNREPLEALIELKKKKRVELMKGKPYAYLASIVTSPARRGQGAASELIKWGLSLAQAHHLSAFVEASPISRSLFLKHGFEQVDTLTIDLRPWGTAHTEEYSLMRRPAPPLPPPGTIVISPWLTNADFFGFPAVEDAAFGESSPLSDIMFGPSGHAQPHGSSNSNSNSNSADPAPESNSDVEFIAIRVGDFIDTVTSDPTNRCVKAFDPTTNQIVGTAHWNFYLSPSTDAHVFPPFRYPPDGNPALGAHYFGSLLRTQEEHMRGQAYLFMRLLVVHPSHQGRGIGRRMLEWGLEQADQLGVRAWIDASPAGLGLYKKLGWEEVSRLEIDLAEWGGKEWDKDVTVSLIREPKDGLNDVV